MRKNASPPLMTLLNWNSMARSAPTAPPDGHFTETPDGPAQVASRSRGRLVGFIRTHQQLLRALDADLANRRASP